MEARSYQTWKPRKDEFSRQRSSGSVEVDDIQEKESEIQTEFLG